jgi:hypothetical protein
MNNFTSMLIVGFVCALIISPWWTGFLIGAGASLIISGIWDGLAHFLRPRA